MRIKIGICDDCMEDILKIKTSVKKVLESSSWEYEISVFSENQDIEDKFQEVIELDILFLDIRLPGENGIKIAEKILKETSIINIIFVTNMNDMVFEAIHCRPFRFIRKEFLEIELEESINAVLDKISDETILYNFGSCNKVLKIQIRDVVYIESKAHYLHIHLRDNMHVIRGKISDYQDKLRCHGFLRVHHGFLVNMREVYSISSKNITLDDGEMLPVSRKNINDIRKAYSEFYRRNTRNIDWQ